MHKRPFIFAAHVSLAGLLYGLDTGSIGSITSMNQFTASIGLLSPSQHGIYVACILLSASISSLFSGHISDRFSRKWTIFAGSMIALAGTITSATVSTFRSLIIARLTTGLGAGQTIAASSVYLVEIAPSETRGVIACVLHSYVVLGVTAGYFISYGSQYCSGSVAWRLPFIIQAVVASMLCIGMVFMPFSPRWLLQVGRIEDARIILTRLRGNTDPEEELHKVQESLIMDKGMSRASFGEILNRRYIKRTLLGISMVVLQQLTGISTLLYYAPILFQQAGFTTQRASFLASGITGLVMIACTIPAQIWIDRWGRRKPLIIGGSAMAVSLIMIGSLFARFGAVEDSRVLMKNSKGRWVVTIMLYMFAANFSWSWAVVGKIYACEVIPNRLRAKVCAMEHLAYWMTNFTIAFTAPIFLRASPSGPYFLHAAAMMCAVVLCVFIPETKGKSLEEIEGMFEKRGETQSD